MKTKINYQIREKYILKKIEMCYLQSLQQNRKSHTRQIKDLNKKVEESTRAMEMLIFKI